MSYGIDLKDKEGNVVADFNITYNVSGMFYSVFPEEGIRVIYGKSSDVGLAYLLTLHNNLIMHSVDMKKFEPDNGWGTWENTVKVINKMCMVAAEHPDCVWCED